MELSILLAEQIFSLLLMVLTGYVVRKLNVVPKSGRKVLASIVLYVSAPCIVFDSFQIEYSSEKLFGLVVGFAAACIALAVFIWAASVCKKIFHLSASEQTSVTYANTGNMIIPLVNNILGSEYVLYTSPYNCTQTALLWIHAYNLITGNKNVQLKKILLNPNIIAMVAGLIFFLLGIQLPGPLHHTVTQLGSLIGPLSMLNVGFIMAEENLLDVFKGRKIWLVTILRLIILPMIMIFCVRLTGITSRFPQTKSVLLISLLAAAAPTASSIAQFAEIADNDAVPAGKINILSTLCCIITMPAVIMIYQVLC